MMAAPRLSLWAVVRGPATLPAYDPRAHGVGIVHFGPGAFFRAHVAAMTDAALAAAGGDWRITGLALRGAETASQLNPQDGLYTLIERGSTRSTARVIGSVAGVLVQREEAERAFAVLTAPATRIVSLTVTEKAYGLDRAARGCDPAHPAVAADLADPRHPCGVLGILTEALRRRREAGVPPFTVLSCDNLPDNGGLLHAAVTDFARRATPELAGWIGEEVAFPATMVDRITPASTAQTLADATAATGCEDLAAVETEPFLQWVVEDSFPTGRPEWEAGGAVFVKNVAPYEAMKIRMLNGAHSMLAYTGVLSGCTFVREVMARQDHAALVDRHMRAAQATLPRLGAVDLDAYRAALLVRFGNPAIHHRTAQIATDGTEKLPQRIFTPAIEALNRGGEAAAFAFATAAWMRYCTGRTDTGESYALGDPREAEIARALAGAATAEAVSTALHDLPGLFPERLRSDPGWRRTVAAKLDEMLARGMRAAISAEIAEAAVGG